MPDIKQSNTRNRLLRNMSADDFALLAPHLEPRHHPRGHVLFKKNALPAAVWFLERGIGSLIAISPEGQRVECGVFGIDGFAPVGLSMGGGRAPYEGQIQISDDCFEVNIDAFQEAINRSITLLNLMLRYAHALSVQIAYTALSNAVHSIEERLARWILMCHDRSEDDKIPITHKFMSVMLAVRRPSVTTSLHMLEGNGFIRSERGCIRIRNRAGLEEFASDSYGQAEQEYTRLIGPMRWVDTPPPME